jgi:type II secretory pathway pseudopilin PulG
VTARPRRGVAPPTARARRRRRVTRRRAGFTLLELLVSLGILTVGIASVLALFAVAVSLHVQTLDREDAARAVRSLRTSLASGVASGALAPGAEVPLEGASAGLVARIESIEPDPEGRGEVQWIRFVIGRAGRPERGEVYVTAVRAEGRTPTVEEGSP